MKCRWDLYEENTIDAIFATRQKVYRQERLYCAFVDSEKAFDRVPKVVVKRAL